MEGELGHYRRLYWNLCFEMTLEFLQLLRNCNRVFFSPRFSYDFSHHKWLSHVWLNLVSGGLYCKLSEEFHFISLFIQCRTFVIWCWDRQIKTSQSLFILKTSTWHKAKSRDGVVCIATGYGLDKQGVGVRVPVWWRIFSTSSRRGLRSTQPRIQWVPGALSRG
jgi:hypothetical protein